MGPPGGWYRDLMNDDMMGQILSSLGPNAISSMAGQLGASPEQTSSGVAVALPMILGALGKNASQPEGAAALHSALQRDHAAGPDLGSVLGAALGGGGSGAGILGHLLGAKRETAAQGIGQASGLDGQQAMQLLVLLAPVVMAYLAQRSQSEGHSPESLGGLLGQQRRHLDQNAGVGATLMNAVLDKDGDGDVDLGDVVKAAGGPQGIANLLGGFFKK